MLILPEHGACFVCVPKTGTQALTQYLEKHLRTSESRKFSVESLHDYHASLAEVDETGQLPFSIYNMWSFAVVRNPFERIVSYCASADLEFERNPQESVKKTLIDFLENGQNRWMFPQSYFTSGVKQLYRFEALDEAVRALKVRFDISDKEPMPKVNESFHDRYPMYFDGDTKLLAEYAYAEDLQAFGYRF